jgi:tripartite-type tricarboxylate transporter receptor subunit TctC
MRRLALLVSSLLFAIGPLAPAVAAEAYPSRPIRIIVPFPPGGGADMMARVVGTRLGEAWKVPVVVENKPGGNTLIAAEAAAKAAPDGYTLFVPIDSTLAMNQSLYAKLPYDPIASFAPITLAASMPMVVSVHPGVSVQNIAELIALAKNKQSRLAYAHGALPAQVAGEVFKTSAAVDMVAIPYKGSAPAITDVIGGSVPVLFDALGPSMPHIKSGKLKVLAVTSKQRSAVLPQVPTLAEAGLADIDLVTWNGFVAPAGTPKDIVDRLHTEIVRILQLPETREQLATVGMSIVASTPEQFARTIRDDAQRFGRIIKQAGIRLD